MGEAYRWNWLIEWGTPSSAHMYAVKKHIFQGRSEFQEIQVLEYEDLGKALVLDGKTQSAIIDEFVYHEALVHPAMLLHGSPEKVLILGGGEGATAREVLRFKAVKRVVMVDIDPVVIEVAKKYLPEWHQGSFDDPRLELIIGDGLKYVMEEGETFDVIIADLADPIEAGPAYKLYVKEFYEAVKKRLRPGGVFVTQATSPTLMPYTFGVIYNTIRSVFAHASYYMVYVKSFDSMWGFVLASDDKDPEELNRVNIDERLAQLVEGENRFYDSTGHRWMFSIPKHIRTEVEGVKEIATMDNPVFTPA
ncbi:MAG: polyamine aminopropyltransferase [Desulfurococcales archaeon]|nr:polyamine aminopropyltransferase [Desulfurococcales archaeon]